MNETSPPVDSQLHVRHSGLMVSPCDIRPESKSTAANEMAPGGPEARKLLDTETGV